MRAWEPATPQDIAAYHNLTATLDPAFAAIERRQYEAASIPQLEALAHQAWLCCEGDRFALAKGYINLRQS